MKNIYTKQLLKELSDIPKRENKLRLSGRLTATIAKSRNNVFGNNEAQLLFIGSTSITANTFTNTNCNDANRTGASFSFLVLDTSQEIELITFSRKKNYSKTKTINIYTSTALMLVVFLLLNRFSYAVTGPGVAWQYVRKITLSSSTPVANFQVKVTLTTGQYTNMNAAGNDLRFYDINNNVCNYWIETWNNAGTSTIWVNVVSNASTTLFMYYGNAAASAASNGSTTFDFFDDFSGSSLGSNWQQSTSNGSISVSGGTVTLSCNSNSGSAYLSSAFSPNSTSFYLETKHRESRYYRNRFYAANGYFGGNPFGFDNGYFNSGGTGAYTSANTFWNGFQTSTTVNRNTDYLAQWQITDGNGATYNWNTYLYSTMGLIRSNSNPNTATPVRYITIGVTEANITSTILDWVRVRKSNSTFTDPTATIGSQVSNNLSASISSQTNVLCFGQSTGTAKVTGAGGSTPYTYSWNSSPVQNTQTAANLAAGNYIAIVTDNIGLSATATATLTQPASAVTSSATSSNISCFNASDGQIDVSGSNGVLPYVYSIDNGVHYQSGSSFTNLPPGNYKIRVKDNNGCESAAQ